MRKGPWQDPGWLSCQPAAWQPSASQAQPGPLHLFGRKVEKNLFGRRVEKNLFARRVEKNRLARGFEIKVFGGKTGPRICAPVIIRSWCWFKGGGVLKCRATLILGPVLPSFHLCCFMIFIDDWPWCFNFDSDFRLQHRALRKKRQRGHQQSEGE